MAQPKSNLDVFKRLAQEIPTQSCQFGNVRVDGLVGYSWAEPIINVLPNIILITNKRWSNSTAEQLRGYLAQVMRRGRLVIEVRHPAEPARTVNYEQILYNAQYEFDTAVAPTRIRDVTRGKHIANCRRHIEDYDRLQKHFPRELPTQAEHRAALLHSLANDLRVLRIEAAHAVQTGERQ